MPAGNFLGQTIAGLPYRFILVPIGMVMGFFIVKAEPAVYVLMEQVEEITSGAISGKAMGLSLSLGVAVSVGLSMFRVLSGISIFWFIVPGYVIAVCLSFFVPKIFTAIAFDSGGVAPTIHHERTFVSRIDGSVQYYSVAPALRTDPGDTAARAFVLTVHGASVEARNQARAYKQKAWANIVAPTNRRPFGFNWEEWGRIDALEVLAEARRIFKTDPSRIYLTGHSMGGHGTWYLGTTYPSLFAAIAPCAG